ncbi:hypothetical protein BDC45DRAFT_611369 [Circinella umbellata]|nr:hypothetical protein BDC45DRAFT_611369 [Circinella umbellata]
MDTGTMYGFSIPTLILGAVGSLGAIFQYIHIRRFKLRYTLLFLAAAFTCIRRASFIAAINIDTNNPESSRHMLEGNMVRMVLYKMFIPFLYCAFFQTCHDILSMTTTTTVTTLRSKMHYYATHEFCIILAYLWTLILIVINIAYGVLFTNNFPFFTEEKIILLQNMTRFTSYSVWTYFVCAILQLFYGWNGLRPYMISLLSYLLTVCIGTVGMTAVQALPTVTDSDEVISQTVSFVLVELVGLFGLMFGLFASRHYWVLYTTKQQRNDQSVSSVTDFKSGMVVQDKHSEDPSIISSTAGSTSKQQQLE